MERKTKEVGGDANLQSPNFYALLALFSQLSVLLKLCITTHEYRCAFSVKSVMP